MSQIPPLPDPGPEPIWYTKNLGAGFRQLRITDEAICAELGELEHVTREYLNALYNQDAERKLTSEELLALIRSGRPFGEEAAVEEEDGWDEDEDEGDWEEDEDEDAF